MKLTLQKLILINFKGVQKMVIDFSNDTTISGANATFKTTVNDAWNYLLFGKDSEDRSDFNIKTLDANNQVIPKLDHEVTGFIDIDGITTVLKRVFKEKWTKRRGEPEPEFTGNETLYYYNDVPMQQKEYKEKINSIIREDLFKLLTNPYYFNSILPWLDRRKILFEVAGEFKDSDVINLKPEFGYLSEVLAQKSLEQFKKEIAAKKKKTKDDLLLIPARIDEVNRKIPIQEPDYKSIQKDIDKLQKEVAKLDEQIADKTKISAGEFEAVQQKQRKISQLKLDIQKKEFEITSAINKEIANLLSKKNSLNAESRNLDIELDRAIGEMGKNIEFMRTNNITLNDLRQKYKDEDKKQLTLNANEFICPTCLREYPDADIEQKKQEMIANFNRNKVKVLEEINQKGITLKKELSDRENLIKNAEAGIKLLKEKVEWIKQQVAAFPEPKTAALSTPEIEKLKIEIKAIEEQPEPPKADTTELKLAKETLIKEQDFYKAQLTVKDEIEKSRVRLRELEEEEKTLGQVLSGLERHEFILADFTKTKISMIEQNINQMFDIVKFKMYNQNINGNEEETCECLVGGVPYSDLNSAMKINAGLDCIKTLQGAYDVYAPCWVDNCEGVNELLSMPCQIIKLFVTLDKTLKIS